MLEGFLDMPYNSHSITYLDKKFSHEGISSCNIVAQKKDKLNPGGYILDDVERGIFQLCE